MNRSRAFASALVLLALPVAIRPAAAAWPHEPNNGNVALSTAANTQISPMIVPDGAGGAIVTWYDRRSGTNHDIYAQRISAAGVPQWTANGVALCIAAGEQYAPTIVPDGAGGAIVTWYDVRSSTYDIYAQRISAAGVPQWTANGVALCTAANQQFGPTIASDGAGGAIVTWYDYRSGIADIYAQRISGAGVPQWTVNGVALCTAADVQSAPTIVPDGAGGAIVTWNDFRSGADDDIYAQRVSAAGVPQWSANGVALCTAPNIQASPTIASDGAGGAIVTWYDVRSDINYEIYAQSISAAGVLQWTGNGVALGTAASEESTPSIVSDGAGGAIVTWYDFRSGASEDIYAQRISAAGEPQWTANGVALCTAASLQAGPTIVSDGAGGAIVTWYDYRSGPNSNIYAQRISAVGVPQWTANGVALCTAVNIQSNPVIVSDGVGGAIVTWNDFRSSNYDIYAQRVERYGQLGNPEPTIARVRDVPNDQGGLVKVSWDASYLDADPVYGVFEYRIFRSAPNSLATRAVSRRAVTEDSDLAAREGVLLARTSAGVTEYWEFVGTQAAEAFAGYSRVVATTSDSVGGSNPRTLFMVEARASTSISAARWTSAPDSGYSVDNLPPAAPAPFTGEYAAGTTNLHWNRNAEADLAGYQLYRGTSTSFTPGPGNLVAALPDTGYADPAGAPYVYKLTAVDSHGNESPVATLVLGGTVDAGGAAPSALSFAPPSPNPARGTATLDYTLSRAGHVRLSVYDAAGRCVQVLRDSELVAGAHRESFALRDEAGRSLASGLYLVRLEAEGRVLTRRLAAIR